MNATLVKVSDKVWTMPEPLGLYAGELLKRGLAYFKAFELLRVKNDNELDYPVFFLMAHCVELLLKSYLAACGVPKSDLKDRSIGHNVSKAFDMCAAKGLIVPDSMMRPLAKQIHEINRDFDLRYPSGYILSIPTAAMCSPVIASLIAAVEGPVGAAALKAQLIYAADTRHLQGAKIRWSD